MRHSSLRFPEKALARRPVIDRRRFRPGSCLLPSSNGSGAASHETRLGSDFLRLIGNDPAVASFEPRPETFAWRDGCDGKRHAFVPDYLVILVDGSKVYRAVKGHMRLLRDPELSGRRARIELECAVRGGTMEFWTEREVREATSGSPLLRVATFQESNDLAESLREFGEFGSPKPPSLVMRIADRLGLSQPRQVGRTFLARSHLTGILMAILCDLHADPETGALVWKTSPRRT